MKSSPRPARTIFKLSSSIQQQVNSYALVAAAAGVSVLALTEPADCKIVYTPAHVRINPDHTIPLDINNDGVVDFLFLNYFSTFDGTMAFDELFVLTTGSGTGIWVHKNRIGQEFAGALRAGVKVGPKGPLRAGFQFMGSAVSEGSGSRCNGPWGGAHNKYLGLKFRIHGKSHFGWARLNVECKAPKLFGLLTGYAYETIPNKPIITGKTKSPDAITVRPATLGELAVGRSMPR